jgi:hypothetical protein
VSTVSRTAVTTFQSALRSASMRDPRAVETAAELSAALRRHMAAKARLRTCAYGSADWVRTRLQVDDLRMVVLELSRTLRERPWTEV